MVIRGEQPRTYNQNQNANPSFRFGAFQPSFGTFWSVTVAPPRTAEQAPRFTSPQQSPQFNSAPAHDSRPSNPGNRAEVAVVVVAAMVEGRWWRWGSGNSGNQGNQGVAATAMAMVLALAAAVAVVANQESRDCKLIRKEESERSSRIPSFLFLRFPLAGIRFCFERSFALALSRDGYHAAAKAKTIAIGRAATPLVPLITRVALTPTATTGSSTMAATTTTATSARFPDYSARVMGRRAVN